MTARNLLVELLVEELPPKALKKLGEAFATALAASLKSQGLIDANSVATPYASPRRLAAQVTAVVAKAADKAVQQKLMPVSVALDAAGNATPALLKKLSALGADASVVPTLKRAMDGKAEALFLDSVVPGATLAKGLQTALEAALGGLPIPKVMSYQLADGWSSVNFVRPAHRLVALHGADIVPISALGLTAGRETQGHRFEAAKPVVSIRDADSYAEQMETEGAVEMDACALHRGLGAARFKNGADRHWLSPVKVTVGQQCRAGGSMRKGEQIAWLLCARKQNGRLDRRPYLLFQSIPPHGSGGGMSVMSGLTQLPFLSVPHPAVCHGTHDAKRGAVVMKVWNHRGSRPTLKTGVSPQGRSSVAPGSDRANFSMSLRLMARTLDAIAQQGEAPARRAAIALARKL